MNNFYSSSIKGFLYKHSVTASICIIASLLILTGCAEYINPIETNPIGKTYQGSINFCDMQLPLPEGEWKVVGRGYYHDEKFVEIVLGKDIGNTPHSRILIRRDSVSNSFSGYKPSPFLERENILHVVVNNNQRLEAHDGWGINHIRPFFHQKKSPAIKEVFKHIIDNQLVMPGNFIKILHHFTGAKFKSKLLIYSLLVNPEVEGFDPPTNAEWASSDWNILKINKDPKKVAYIEQLKKEGAIFHQKLKEAFGQ